MIVHINYSNEIYYKSQLRNTQTALEVGQFDKSIPYSPKDIDRGFYKKNKHILQLKRGNGYWLWKPYIVKKTLEKLNWGDYLYYSDSGSYFTGSIHPLIAHAESVNQDLIVFELRLFEKDWTKRDAFVLMDCDSPKYTDSRQRISGHHLWKKTPFAMQFIGEQLQYSMDERIITDMENQCGLPNYPGFKEHRHDQSIMSLLSKKHNLRAFRVPQKCGKNMMEKYPDSNYAPFIQPTRLRNKFSFSYRLKEFYKKQK